MADIVETKQLNETKLSSQVTRKNENEHDWNCTCDECAILIKKRYDCFDVLIHDGATWNQKKRCPKCNCVIWPRRIGPWRVWGCWRCHFDQGCVTMFKDEPDKMYGFALAQNKTVYFHGATQMEVICDGGDYLRLRKPEQLTSPKENDNIIFQYISTEKGHKATWWAFWSQYSDAKQVLDNRPRYRLRKRIGHEKLSALSADPSFTNVWEGMNLCDLRYRFPLATNPVFDDGSEAIYFEMERPDGSWVPCIDPR